MSKDKKEKAKPTFEEAQAQLEQATADRKAALKAKEDFEKASGLKPKKDHSEDPKHGKEWKKLKKAHTEAKEVEEAAKAILKEVKPAKVRETKYEYPADCVTADDKKKYRAKMRTAAKSKDKPAKEEKPKKEKKAEKASKEEAAPAAEEKSGKKKKKVKASAED